MRTHDIEYRDGSTPLRGWWAAPAAGERLPVVLIVHAWRGHDEFVRRAARHVAELGCVGFAVDMYGDGVLGDTSEECAALMTPFLEHRPLIKQRLTAAISAACTIPCADATRLGAMGFCFGGLCALDAARLNLPGLRGVAAFHGLFTPLPGAPTAPIAAKVLAMHGYDDPMATPQQMIEFANELTARRADWEICAYGGTMHAFTNPDANNADFGTVFQERANRRSHERLRDFWRECLA